MKYTAEQLSEIAESLFRAEFERPSMYQRIAHWWVKNNSQQILMIVLGCLFWLSFIHVAFEVAWLKPATIALVILSIPSIAFAFVMGVMHFREGVRLKRVVYAFRETTGMQEASIRTIKFYLNLSGFNDRWIKG